MRETNTEQQYRQSLAWDRVARSTHCVDCHPGACPCYGQMKED